MNQVILRLMLDAGDNFYRYLHRGGRMKLRNGRAAENPAQPVQFYFQNAI